MRDSLPPCRRIHAHLERAGLPSSALPYTFIENGRLLQLRLRCVKTRCRGCYTVIQSLGQRWDAARAVCFSLREEYTAAAAHWVFNRAAAESTAVLDTSRGALTSV